MKCKTQGLTWIYVHKRCALKSVKVGRNLERYGDFWIIVYFSFVLFLGVTYDWPTPAL